MQIETLITIISLGVVALGGIIGIVVAIIRGDIKNFIVSTMEEAEKMGISGADKLKYVIQKVKDKYKIMEVVLNVRKFIEYIISISKEINHK